MMNDTYYITMQIEIRKPDKDTDTRDIAEGIAMELEVKAWADARVRDVSNLQVTLKEESD